MSSYKTKIDQLPVAGSITGGDSFLLDQPDVMNPVTETLGISSRCQLSALRDFVLGAGDISTGTVVTDKNLYGNNVLYTIRSFVNSVCSKINSLFNITTDIYNTKQNTCWKWTDISGGIAAGATIVSFNLPNAYQTKTFIVNITSDTTTNSLLSLGTYFIVVSKLRSSPWWSMKVNVLFPPADGADETGNFWFNINENGTAGAIGFASPNRSFRASANVFGSSFA
jgi:hypothetical protein